MAGTQHFSPSDIQFQLVYDRGQYAESSYLNIPQVLCQTFNKDFNENVEKVTL